MLRQDPIICALRANLLPTESEARRTAQLLNSQPALKEAFVNTVEIARDEEASLARWIFVAKMEGHHGDGAAREALNALHLCLLQRNKYGLDSLLRQPPFDNSYLELFRSVLPLGFHGVTRDGNPVLIIRYGAVDTNLLASMWTRGETAAVDGINAFTMCFVRCVPEYVTAVLMNEETERQQCTVDRMIAVIDVGGVGWEHWQGCLRSFVQQYMRVTGSVYPEIIAKVFVANAPWFVANICWPVVKSFLPAITGLKVSVLNSRRTGTALRELIRSDQLPRILGGTCNCEECVIGPLLKGGSMGLWEDRIGAPWRADGNAAAYIAQDTSLGVSSKNRGWRSCCAGPLSIFGWETSATHIPKLPCAQVKHSFIAQDNKASGLLPAVGGRTKQVFNSWLIVIVPSLIVLCMALRTLYVLNYDPSRFARIRPSDWESNDPSRASWVPY